MIRGTNQHGRGPLTFLERMHRIEASLKNIEMRLEMIENNEARHNKQKREKTSIWAR